MRNYGGYLLDSIKFRMELLPQPWQGKGLSEGKERCNCRPVDPLILMLLA